MVWHWGRGKRGFIGVYTCVRHRERVSEHTRTYTKAQPHTHTHPQLTGVHTTQCCFQSEYRPGEIGVRKKRRNEREKKPVGYRRRHWTSISSHRFVGQLSSCGQCHAWGAACSSEQHDCVDKQHWEINFWLSHQKTCQKSCFGHSKINSQHCCSRFNYQSTTHTHSFEKLFSVQSEKSNRETEYGEEQW